VPVSITQLKENFTNILLSTGVLKGIEYFKCPDKRGLMLRSADIQKL
jgi:hypothetical protein